MAKLRPSGSLKVTEHRRLAISYQHRGAYEQDGRQARDSLRMWGSGIGACPDPLPDRLPIERATDRDEEVVWGGFLTGHYGHFLTESVARLWPLLPGGGQEGMPVVFATSSRAPFASEWEKAFGLNIVDLPREGVSMFSRVHVPEPSWRMGGWVAPEIRDIHRHARARLEVDSRPPGGVLWLSRSRLGHGRGIRDEALCLFILKHHLKVINPETMSLAQQVGEIEACDAVVGPVGSAFHTLLLAGRQPRRLYLSAGAVAASFPAQDLVLDGASDYVHAIVACEMRLGNQRRLPQRLLIPETIRALADGAVPQLNDDVEVVRFARPETLAKGSGRWSETTDLSTLISRVLLDPNQIDARMDLGDRFEQEGESDCAYEQYRAVTDTVENCTYALLRLSRLLSRLSRSEEAAQYAKRVLALDPASREAQRYSTGSP